MFVCMTNIQIMWCFGKDLHVFWKKRIFSLLDCFLPDGGYTFRDIRDAPIATADPELAEVIAITECSSRDVGE